MGTYTVTILLRAQEQISGAIKKAANAMKKMEGATTKLQKMFKRIQNTAIGVVTGMIAFEAIHGVTESIRESIDTFMRLEKRLTALAVISRESGESIRDVSERYLVAAMDAAREFGIGVEDAAIALDSLVRAGMSGSEAISSLNAVLALATVEGVNAAQVADILASTLAQFGLNADQAMRAADALTNAATIGVSTMTQYATGLSYCGAVAHQLGFNLEETLSALVMVDASIKDATKSGRYLQAMLSALAQKSDELGFSIYDSSGKILNMTEIIKRLYTHLRSFGSEQERNAYLFEIFGEQGARAIAAIIGYIDRAVKQGKSLDQALKEITDTIAKQGTVTAVTGEIMETTAGSAARLAASFEVLRISIVEAIAPLAPFLDRLSHLIDIVGGFVRTVEGLPVTLHQWAAAQKEIYKLPPIAERFIPSVKEYNEFIDQFIDKTIKAGQSIGGVSPNIKKYEDLLNKMNNVLNEGVDSHEEFGESAENVGDIISSLASKFGLEKKAIADVINQVLDLNIVYDENAELIKQVSEALGVNEEQARRLIDALMGKAEAIKQATEAQKEYENIVKTTTETLQSSLTTIINYGAVYGPLTTNINKATDALAKFKELGIQIPNSLQEALDKVKELDDRLRDFKSRAEGLGGVGEVAGIGEAFIELRKSFREEEIAPKIRKLQDEIDELTKRLEEVRENTSMNKSIRETQIEALEKEIEKRRQQIEELKKSADYTAIEAETRNNLGIIQKTISFHTQVMSLYQRGLQLAMIGATEAGEGMMNAALLLASALEDGIVTDEEKKKILEELGVQFDETGKPILSLKDIMKSFQDQVKDNITTINDLKKAMGELDGLESHIYIYRHEITVKETRSGAGGTGTTMKELGVETLHGHKTGLWKVPYNNYIARLHRGEMVLPRNVAEWFRKGGLRVGSKVVNVHNEFVLNNPVIRSEADIDELAEKISRKIVSNLRVMT